MGATLQLYRVLSPAVAALVPLAAPWHRKLAAGVAGRRGLAQRLAAAAPGLQGCVWFHAASVGEFMQGVPLIHGLRDALGVAMPPVAATHFSPSGYEFARRHPCADLHEYLPLDTPQAMTRLVTAWRPRLLVFMSGDVWPNLVLAAHRERVPLVLMAGSLPPDSARLRGPGRALYRDLFDRFAHLGVVADADRKRFRDGLGVRAPVSVTGNTRVEQVIARFEASAGGEVSARLSRLGGRRLVLGSTWPPDERLWLPVLPELCRRIPDLRVILCPHEPHPEHLTRLADRLAATGLRSTRLSALLAAPTDDPTVSTSTTVGVLAEIYRAGQLAHVGGAFTTGVHNTLEPAVAGLPVIFGPRIQNAPEAAELVARGAAWICREPGEVLARATALFADPAALAAASAAARRTVLDQRGALERSLAVLLPLVRRVNADDT
ncbi:MAG: glycosyltransferase N-terminal domain-containing protein [Candidatus Krumholzibacteriia bacterium]